jgi:sterol desaturase/sphingolipid hydroxylase (fatty acid hydroxylase superfamily)
MLYWAVQVLAFGAGWLAYLFITFRLIEGAVPARRDQPVLRPEWATDLAFFSGQYLFFSGLVLGVLESGRDALAVIVPAGLRAGFATWPWWIQAMAVVLASDFLIYWGHRLQHKVDFLWRFHSVHHSAEHLDWLAAHREHPLDTVYTVGLVNLPAYLMGFPLESIAVLITFRGIWAIYIHSNVRMPIGPLRVLIGAPELHHWHHDRERTAGNYGNVCPLMDVLFGTYRCPDHEPASFGLSDRVPRSYLRHLVDPLRGDRV